MSETLMSPRRHRGNIAYVRLYYCLRSRVALNFVETRNVGGSSRWRYLFRNDSNEKRSPAGAASYIRVAVIQVSDGIDGPDNTESYVSSSKSLKIESI